MPSRIIHLPLLVAVFITNCSDRGDVVSASIQNSAWRLESIESSGHTTSIPDNEPYTLHFDNDTLVSGQVHCNTYFTNYRFVLQDSIAFGPFIVTKMGCPLPSNQNEFRLAFDSANSINISSTQLRLYYQNRTKTLIFDKVM